MPPLLASTPSRGSRLLRSPAPAKAQLLPLSRLLPPELIAPLQLPPVLLATRVLVRVTVPAGLEMPPPMGAEFSPSVTLRSVAVPPLLKTPPPPLLAPLPERVTLVSVAALALKMPPPFVPALLALLPLTVLAVMVSVLPPLL